MNLWRSPLRCFICGDRCPRGFVGRQERPLDPNAGPVEAFAAGLRQLRRAAGNPGYRTLARRAGYSASALSSAAAGRVLPSLAVTLAYAGVCGGDLEEWERRWEQAAAQLAEEEPPVVVRPSVVPRELPLDVYGFTGRSEELAELDRLLAATQADSSAVVISAVAGAGGVGKTALAVHWAHEISDRFPDGQLYVDLRGYDPDQPLEAADVLASFLRALGLDGAEIPYDEGERAARFRSLVAGRRMLILLDAAADNRTAVRAVFSWSYQHLPPDVAGAFRLLGQHPGGDFDTYAAAALVDTDLDEASRLIQALTRGHLLQESAPGRYRMHDLIRMYAAELAGDDPAPRTRLFDHYLSTVAAAMDTLYPAERYRRPVVAPPATPAPDVGDSALARAWLDAERANLVAATTHSVTHAGPVAATIGRYLDTAPHYSEAITVHSHALLAARQLGDRRGEGDALHNLGAVYWRWGRYDEAVEHYLEALAIQRQIGDRAGEALALGNLGVVCHQSARYAEALDYHQQGLAICRELGNRAAEACP